MESALVNSRTGLSCVGGASSVGFHGRRHVLSSFFVRRWGLSRAREGFLRNHEGFLRNKKVPSIYILCLRRIIYPRCHSNWPFGPLFRIPTYTPPNNGRGSRQPILEFFQDCPRKSIPFSTPYRNPTACGSLWYRLWKCTPLSLWFSCFVLRYINTCRRFCQENL